MINDLRAENACAFIRDHAEEYGKLAASVKVWEHKLKVLRSVAFSEGQGTVADREAQAYMRPEIADALKAYQNDVAELETLRTQIKAAELTFECWRTQQATARKGP